MCVCGTRSVGGCVLVGLWGVTRGKAAAWGLLLSADVERGCASHSRQGCTRDLTWTCCGCCVIPLVLLCGGAQRVGLFSAFAFFQGASLGTLIEVLLFIDSSIIVHALAATTAVFLCFSGAALFGKSILIVVALQQCKGC